MYSIFNLSSSILDIIQCTIQDVITFNTVLDAISKSREKGAATRAEAILNKMQSMYEEGAKEIQPDTFSFASVLNAYANSDEPGAAEKCEDILKHMQLLYENGNHRVRPNTICFATVIVSIFNDIHM